MQPPYIINSKILNLVVKISNILGRIESANKEKPQIKLRKQNRARSIYASLSIEGNTLSAEQIEDLLEGKKVIGPQLDILAANNAIKAYEKIDTFKYQSLQSLLSAHKLFMTGLIKEAGKLRTKNVGILKGNKVAHVAPQPKMLKKLMNDLFDYLKNDENKLIMSCVFHYELEFIHPFADGNGRLGRFWQTIILRSFNPVFEFIPIEHLIKAKQKQYYKVLGDCDKAGESTKFIEFMLKLIHESLLKFDKEVKAEKPSPESRIEKARSHFKKKQFSRKDYMKIFGNISTATASRDLSFAVKNKILKAKGKQRNTIYQFC